MKTKIGYKVCCMVDGHPYSSHSHTFTRYYLNKWCYPKDGNGPLAVFKTLKDAKDFTEVFQIYKCKYVPSTETSQWYRYYGNLVAKISLGMMPEGKALASKVMLLKRIK